MHGLNLTQPTDKAAGCGGRGGGGGGGGGHVVPEELGLPLALAALEAGLQPRAGDGLVDSPGKQVSGNIIYKL